MKKSGFFAHHTAAIAESAQIGAGSKIWHQAQIRERAAIGENCIVGKNVYIDAGVVIGSNCKIQNNASIYHGATLEDGVFVGPHAVITNDKIPRAIKADGDLKDEADWIAGKVLIGHGASLGAACVILPGITVGSYAMVGAGAVVTQDVPAYALVAGNPARIMGEIDAEGRRVKQAGAA